MCSLVNAKSGGCAEDCGFCAQSRYAEADTPMHAMMEPEQILEHARAAEAAGAHRFCMVTQGQGLSKRDFGYLQDLYRIVNFQDPSILDALEPGAPFPPASVEVG